MPESAVVVCVPEAEPIVAKWRGRYDPSAAVGVPAHITLLYPFVPPAELSAEVERDLEAELATVAPFDVTFHRTNRFGEQVLFLDPDPDRPFLDMIRRVSTRFRLSPYGGTIPLAEVRPHLTVVDGDASVFDVVDRSVRRELPLTSRVSAATILVSDEQSRWTSLRSVPLGGG